MREQPSLPAAFKNLAPYCLLIGAVFLAYSNIYSNDFLYDDETLILHDRFLRSWSYLPSILTSTLYAGGHASSAYYRPLQILSYLIVFQLSGPSRIAFHLLNLSVHAANACLVFKLGQKLSFRFVSSLLAALLWALHPLNTEAVTYMSGTADLLSSLFCLLGVIVLVPAFSRSRVLMAVPLMILAFLSKESSVSFPLLAMSCLYFTSQKRFDPKIYMRLWPLAAVTGAYAILHFTLSFHGLEPPKPAPYPVNYAPFATIPVYFGLLLWPAGLHLGHAFPAYTGIWHFRVLAGIGLLVLAAMQVLRRQNARSLPLSWGLCWFLGAHMPLFAVDGIFYEHWMYLPSIGLFLGIIEALFLFAERTSPVSMGRAAPAPSFLLAAVFMPLAALLGFLTCKQNTIWREPVTFYLHTFAQGEPAAKEHNNLGVVYTEQGLYDKAITQYRLAIANSGDTLAVAQANLALTLMAAGKFSNPPEILDHLERALAIRPGFSMALQALSDFYRRQGNAVQAAHYRALALKTQQALFPEAAQPFLSNSKD